MGKPTLARCITDAGSLPAGNLLYRILYWQPKAKLKRHGRPETWIVKTHSDWAGETGLTPKQIRTAMNRLRQAGLIETEAHLFGGGHVKMTWLRLTDAGHRLTPGQTTSALGGTSTSALQGRPQDQQNDTTQHTAVISNEIITAKSPGPLAKTGTPQQGENMATVQEILDGGVRKKPVAKAKWTAAQLRLKWQSTMAGITGAFYGALPLSAISQLKQFEAKCPAGKAEAVMLHCLHNWEGFVGKVKTATAQSEAPSAPHVGFLLKHVTIAVSYAEPKKSTPVKAKVVVAPVQLIAPAPEVKKKPTAAEFLALDADGEE